MIINLEEKERIRKVKEITNNNTDKIKETTNEIIRIKENKRNIEERMKEDIKDCLSKNFNIEVSYYTANIISKNIIKTILEEKRRDIAVYEKEIRDYINTI